MAEIRITGVIGDFFDEESINTEADLAARLAEIPSNEEILVRINSGGGSVFEGFGMYNLLKSAPNTINTSIEGLAASIASLIALAGEKVQMAEVALFMIHKASTMAIGNREELERQMEALKAIDETLLNVYTAKTGMSVSEIEGLMDEEKFMTSEEAKDKGFIDEITNTVDPAMAAIFNKTQNQKVMALKDLFAKFRNDAEQEAGSPDPNEETQTQEEEANGSEEASEENGNGDQQQQTEESENPAAEYVSREEFQALADRISTLAEAVDNLQENLNDQAIDQKVDDRFEALKKGLRTTNNIPSSANNSVTRDQTPSNETPSMKHKRKMKEQMQEIDQQTRNK